MSEDVYMSFAKKNIAKAMQLKEQGNAAFKDGNYPEAIAAYHQIYMYVNGFSQSSASSSGDMMPGQTTSPATPEEMVQIRELKVIHHCNLAMCMMKKKEPNYVKARDNCTKALAIDPDNVKALFRRGKCHTQLNALDEAKADLERVLELQPDNMEAKRELRTLRAAFEKFRKKEQRKFAGMFDRLHDEEAKATGAASASTDAMPPPPPAVAPDASDAANASTDPAMMQDAADPPELGKRLDPTATFEPQDVDFKE